MTLPSRHRIWNSNQGGLRARTLPLGHRGSSQYWVLRVDGKETFLFPSNRRDPSANYNIGSSRDLLLFILTPRGAYCYSAIVHITIHVLPDTHVHLSEVRHLRVKCLAQGNSIETTMVKLRRKKCIFRKTCPKRRVNPHKQQAAVIIKLL